MAFVSKVLQAGFVGAAVLAASGLADVTLAHATEVTAGPSIIIVDDVVLQGIPSDVPLPPNRARAFRPRPVVHVVHAAPRVVRPVAVAAIAPVTVALRRPAPAIWLTVGDGF